MENIRTFIALELPEELKKKLSQVQQKFIEKTGGVRWVKPENLHLTLKFLGSTPQDKVPEVIRALEQAAEGMSRFGYFVSGLGAFPNPRNPKVIWAGMKTGSELAAFQQKLDDSLSSIGVPQEKRPFSAHLTLGRVKDPKARRQLRIVLQEYCQEDLGRFEAARFVFFRSDLQPTGPVYSVLKTAELK